ncbi:unnamed protein product [Tuber aestivum]|uniref:Sm domain-containing protein n=1 Tax=Tuber aestivum TaxID=59557 RepID=A0A292PYV2_9PEZI|nr:unnamed protein product [Tuber aestivum]
MDLVGAGGSLVTLPLDGILTFPPLTTNRRGHDKNPSTRIDTTKRPPLLLDTTTNHEVTIELKNDLSIRGTLKSVDQFLNIKLDDIMVLEEAKYPHLTAVRNVFIRGSVVRYVHLPAGAVDTALLEDATRREASNAATAKGR